MTWIMVSGLGLGTMDLVPKKVLNKIPLADVVFVENYTGLIPTEEIEKLRSMNENLVFLTREDCEVNDYKKIFDALDSGKNVVFLTEGDPMLATTHVNLVIELGKRNIDFELVPSVSIVCASMSLSGLQIYRLGEVLTFPIDYKRAKNSIRDKILRGLDNKKHILILFEMDLKAQMYVGPLEFLEFARTDLKEILDNRIVLISRLGLRDQKIFSIQLKDLDKVEIGQPPWTMILAVDPHPMEKEYLELIQYRPED